MFYFNLVVLVILLMLCACFIIGSHREHMGHTREQYADIGDDGFGHALMGYDRGEGWYPIMNLWQLNQLGYLPWWNSTRYTRNMSHDLRGDVPLMLF